MKIVDDEVVSELKRRAAEGDEFAADLLALGDLAERVRHDPQRIRITSEAIRAILHKHKKKLH
jgi:hypothetical protein